MYLCYARQLYSIKKNCKKEATRSVAPRREVGHRLHTNYALFIDRLRFVSAEFVSVVDIGQWSLHM